MRIRVVDYIAKFIKDELKVSNVFMISGGGAMFLNDGIVKNGNIRVICNHHEQASAMGAVAYSKYTNGFAVTIPTTGCGGTNCITGLLDAWQDNVKVFFISGNDKIARTVRKSKVKLRQKGVQEADIISIVSSITKYAVMIDDEYDIAYHLEKAKFIAETGRPGPVWIDVPQDIQGAYIETTALRHFKENEGNCVTRLNVSEEEIDSFINDLEMSKRPVIIAGNGIRLGNAVNDFKLLIDLIKIPVVSTYLGIDLLSSNHPQFIGRTGIKGDRAGNFTMQNSDLLIAFGSRLSIGTTGYEKDTFARDAKIVVIDIDKEEHKKDTVRVDKIINVDIKVFINSLLRRLRDKKIKINFEWANTCEKWKNQWPTYVPVYRNDTSGINLYYFIDVLNRNLLEDSIVISDAGSAYYVTSQALMIDKMQRYITSGAQAEMGFTIPATIGAYFASNVDSVIGITGDGSFQMNVQELQTIRYHKIPIKLFVWNNNGYLSIRTTQKRFFEGRLIGTDISCGLSFPSIEKISNAYEIKYFLITNSEELEKLIPVILSLHEPVICEIMCQSDQIIAPIVTSIKKENGLMVSKPLEDMYPFLDRNEFFNNMIIKPMEE